RRPSVAARGPRRHLHRQRLDDALDLRRATARDRVERLVSDPVRVGTEAHEQVDPGPDQARSPRCRRGRDRTAQTLRAAIPAVIDQGFPITLATASTNARMLNGRRSSASTETSISRPVSPFPAMNTIAL